MKVRKIASPVAVWIKPVHAVGIEAAQRMTAIRTRAPYLSQAGPRRNRMKMVPATLKIEEVQSCFLSRPRSFLISVRSGAIENQMKNAMKNPHLKKCC
jgi:hypothetical protein